MHRLSACLTATLLLCSTALAAPAELSPGSRVDSVTVYQSSARVIRRVSATLPAGDARVLLTGLPSQLMDDSLRVQGKGGVKAKIYGVSVETQHQETASSPEVLALEARLAELRASEREIAGRTRAAESRLELVRSLKSTYSEDRAKNLGLRPVDLKELNALAEFVSTQVLLVEAQLQAAQKEQEAIQKKVAATTAELHALSPKTQVSSKVVAVELHADKPGTVDLSISYMVPNATWRPVYDARLDPTTQKVTLGVYASVQQTSGEDWEDVRLSVSTAQPQRALHVPELQPIYLENHAVAQGYRDSAPVARSARMAEAASAYQESSQAVNDEGPQPEYALELPEATTHQGLLATTLTTPRRESVEGAGKPRKAFLASFPLEAELIRSTAPSREQQVFLSAKGTNGTPTPLVGGTANVFVGDEFLGRVSLPAVPVGGELAFAFGADDRVKVERKVEQFHETAGLIMKDDVFRYRVRTTLKNLYPHPVTVATLEQIPVSRDEVISVKVLDSSTPTSAPADPMKPGVRSYKVALPPAAEKVIVLEYEIRAPRGKLVSRAH